MKDKQGNKSEKKLAGQKVDKVKCSFYVEIKGLNPYDKALLLVQPGIKAQVKGMAEWDRVLADLKKRPAK